MNKFNLDEYKKGIPALDRNGKKWWFLAEVPKAEYSDIAVISHNNNGIYRTCGITGKFISDNISDKDFISMYHEPKKYYVNVYWRDRRDIYLGDPHESLQEANEAAKNTNDFIKTIKLELDGEWRGTIITYFNEIMEIINTSQEKFIPGKDEFMLWERPKPQRPE